MDLQKDGLITVIKTKSEETIREKRHKLELYILMKIGFSYTGNEALEFHDEMNSKQGKLEGAYNQMICN